MTESSHEERKWRHYGRAVAAGPVAGIAAGIIAYFIVGPVGSIIGFIAGAIAGANTALIVSRTREAGETS